MGNHGSSTQRPGKVHDHKLTTQHSEEDSVPVFCHPRQGRNENNETVPAVPRPVLNVGNTKILPCVIKWGGGGKDVAIAGSFNDWTPLPMVKSEKDFITIVDLAEGVHEYKFLVDGEWRLNQQEKVVANAVGSENNCVEVKESDFEELENALMKDPNDKNERPFSNITNKPEGIKLVSKEEYGQIIPETSPGDKKKGPPVLPPHLLQVILNKDTPVSCEPTLLPEPNHVMLNHMYALSIRDGMMVLSTSHRHRKKCVTTLIYRPI